jgi:hypothetical protein
MFSSLVHLILSLSILYPYLIKFHDFADNSQEGMKHQMMGATEDQKAHDFIDKSNNSNMSSTLSHLVHHIS